MPLKVLVVDDEPAIREMVEMALVRAGFEHASAASAEEAERALNESPPDLLILDWMLPSVSGIDLARRIRSDPTLAGLPITMLTARGEDDDPVFQRGRGVRFGSRRSVRREPLFKGWQDFGGAFDPNAMSPKGFGYLIKPDGAKFAANRDTELLLVPGDDDPPGLVIGEQDDKRNVLAGGAF